MSSVTCSIVAKVFEDNEGGGPYFDFIWQCVTETWDSGRRDPPDIGVGGGGETQNPAPAPDPAEIERLIKSCAINISIVPEDIYNAIRDNKRDVQSLALSIAHAATESSFAPGAVGFQGELGLFQLKLSTANSLGRGTFKREQLFDPGLNTQLGTTHLQNLINSFNGDVRTALGAYKQGETGVRKNGLSKSSQEYADGILGCERAILGGRR
jgi:hypothetical protein